VIGKLQGPEQSEKHNGRAFSFLFDKNACEIENILGF